MDKKQKAKIHSLEAELSRLIVFLIKDVTQEGSHFESPLNGVEIFAFIQLNMRCTELHINFTRNSDLTEKYLAIKEEKTNLIKDKEDAQIQVMELRQTSHSMEKKIESLTNELTR